MLNLNFKKIFYRFDNVTEIIFFSFITIILILPIKVHFEIYDEGIILTSAKRLLDGEIPYKDFWTIYPPGQFYIVSIILKLFGNNIIFTRIFDTFVRIGILTIAYIIIIKFTTRSIAKILIFFLSIIIGSLTFYSNSIFISLFISFLTIFLFFRYKNSNKTILLWWIGFLLGIGIFIRWDFTFYTFNAIILTIIFLNYFESTSLKKTVFKNILSIIYGFTLIFIPIILILNAYIGINELWYHNFVLPGSVIHATRNIAIPLLPQITFPTNFSYYDLKIIYLNFINWLNFYLPITIYILVGVLYKKEFIYKRNNNIPYLLFAFYLFGIQLYSYSIFRYDYLHIFPTTLIAFIFVPLILNQINKKAEKTVKYVVTYLVIILFTFYLFFPFRYYFSRITDYPIYKCNSKIEQSYCFNISKDQEESINFIAKNTEDEEFIFVGNKRHDSILENDVGFYFLSNRRCATKYHELHQGIATTEKVQLEIIEELIINKVNYIVLVNMPLILDNQSNLISEPVKLLDDFINENFYLVKKIGNYEIIKKN